MALERQTIAVPFRGGLDTKTDKRQTPVAKLQRATNVRFAKPGSLRKRYGYEALPRAIANPSGDATTIENGRALASFKNELLAWDPARMYSYDAGTEKWIDKGPMISGKIAQTPVVRNIYGQTYQDGATHPSGLQLYAWEDTSGGVRYSVVDGETGQTVVASTLVSLTACKPKTLAIGNFLVLVFLDIAAPTAPVLKIATLPVVNPTATLSPVAISDAAGDYRQIDPDVPTFDACVVAGAAKSIADALYIVLNNATAFGWTVLAFRSPDLTTLWGSAHGTTPANNLVATVWSDPASAGPVIGLSDASDVIVKSFAAFVAGSTQTQLAADAAVAGQSDIIALTGCSVAPTTVGEWRVGIGIWNSGDPENTALSIVAASTASAFDGTFDVIARSVSLAAKCFPFRGLAYFPLAYTSPLSSTYFLADEAGNLVMRCLSGLAGAFPTEPTTDATATATVTGVGVGSLSMIIGGTTVGPILGSTAGTVAQDMASRINADAIASQLVRAAWVDIDLATSQVVLTAVDGGTAGNAITLSASTTGIHLDVAVSGATLSGGRSLGNAPLPEVTPVDWSGPTEATAATYATNGVTVAAGSGDQTVSIGAALVTVPYTTSPTITAGLLRTAWNANAFAGPLATASGTGASIIFTARAIGTPGNAMLLEVSGDALTRDHGLFTGGTDPTFDADSYDTNSVRWAALVRDFLTTFPSTTTTGTPTTATFTQTGVTALAWSFFSQTESYIRETLGGSLNVGGGFLTQYDGAKPVELGFHVFPELTDDDIVTADTGGHLGSATQDTSYWWVDCYSWTDNTGAIHRSAPSVPVQKTFTSGVDTGKATIALPTLRLTAKDSASPVVHEIYRTIGTSPGIFYLASATVVPVASPATNALVLNSKSADTVTFVDEMSDADIIGNPRLYTTGGVLENSAPPPCNEIVVFENRIFGIDSTNPNVVFFSQEVLPGTAVTFSDFLFLNLDPRIGGARALGVMDEKLVQIGSASIWYVIGSGPDSTGGSSFYQGAQLVPSEAVGCTNPKSVLLTEQGLEFQSSKGAYLLSRNLSVVYAGAEAEDVINDAVVTSALAIPGATEYRLTLDNGSAAVFDSFVGQWEVDSPIDAVDAAIWNGAFVYLRPSGLVLVETPGLFTDNGSPIARVVKTAPIRLAGMAGFQRARLLEILGTYESAHELEVRVTFDGNPSATQSVTITPEVRDTWGSDETWGSGEVWGGRFVPYIWRVMLSVQKCESVQIEIRDVGTGTGEGGAWSSLSFELGVKKGLWKTPASSTYGG